MRTNDDKEQFFAKAYHRYARKLEHMCLKYVGYQEEYRSIVDESVQETFLCAVENYDNLNAVGTIAFGGMARANLLESFSH